MTVFDWDNDGLSDVVMSGPPTNLVAVALSSRLYSCELLPTPDAGLLADSLSWYRSPTAKLLVGAPRTFNPNTGPNTGAILIYDLCDVPSQRSASRCDAGMVFDSGVLNDAGVADSGVPMDSGVTDAGQPDAGVTDAGLTDAGVTDAGQPDAGGTDAGLLDSGSTDAGVTDDAGLDAGRLEDGGMLTEPDGGTVVTFTPACGCSMSGIVPLLGLVSALLAFSRRAPRR